MKQLIILVFMVTANSIFAHETPVCETQLESSISIELCRNEWSQHEGATFLCTDFLLAVEGEGKIFALEKGECRNEVLNNKQIYITCAK